MSETEYLKLSQDQYDSLLPSEQSAYDHVNEIGIDVAKARIHEIEAAAEKEMHELCGGDLGTRPSNYTLLNYIPDDELNERHTLTLGLDLMTPSVPAAAAKRVRERLEARRQKRREQQENKSEDLSP